VPMSTSCIYSFLDSSKYPSRTERYARVGLNNHPVHPHPCGLFRPGSGWQRCGDETMRSPHLAGESIHLASFHGRLKGVWFSSSFQ
jgi:hypothetical protein